MVKAFTPWGVEVNFYTLWCNGQHCKEYPPNGTTSPDSDVIFLIGGPTYYMRRSVAKVERKFAL